MVVELVVEHLNGITITLILKRNELKSTHQVQYERKNNNVERLVNKVCKTKTCLVLPVPRYSVSSGGKIPYLRREECFEVLDDPAAC